MSTYYTVNLPAKPYVKKLIAAVMGEEIRFDSKNMLCMIVRAYLENSNKCGLSKDQVAANLVTRTATIEIKVPLKKMGVIGHTLKTDSIILINRFLEDCFESALVQFRKNYIRTEGKEGRYKGFKEAYYAFADQYNLIIDEDITFDAIKKMDFRSRRKKTQKNFLTNVPSLETLDLMRISA